jgi:probable rRNA maturation factor
VIYFYNEDIKKPVLKYQVIKKWIKAVILKHERRVGDISFIFCSDEYLLSINREYLNHDYYTDIITFNYDDGLLINGDIFISCETVVKNAKEFNCSVEDEFLRVIIHGILHLIGFDDTDDALQEEMTQKENESLSLYLSEFKNNS